MIEGLELARIARIQSIARAAIACRSFGVSRAAPILLSTAPDSSSRVTARIAARISERRPGPRPVAMPESVDRLLFGTEHQVLSGKTGHDVGMPIGFELAADENGIGRARDALTGPARCHDCATEIRLG